MEHCGRTVEQCLWNSDVEQWNSESGTVTVVWWNNGTVLVE